MILTRYGEEAAASRDEGPPIWLGTRLAFAPLSFGYALLLPVLATTLIHSAAAAAVVSVAVVAADMVADPDAAFSLSLYHPHVPRQNTSIFSFPRNNPKPSRTSSRMSQQKNFL
jgi:hypothetical protein